MMKENSFLQTVPYDVFETMHFSQVKSEKRINKAMGLLGEKVTTRIIWLALFLLGAAHKDIKRLFNTPCETFNSFTKRIWKDGIVALEDRRFSYEPEPEPMIAVIAEPIVKMTTVTIEGDEVIIHLPSERSEGIRIPTENKLMIKVVLLTLLQNQMLNSQTVAEILGYTQSHTLYLNRQILSGSTEALLDGRQGQKQCYVFKTEVKAELIQQYIANAIAGKSTAGASLASGLKERCGLDLTVRTITHYVKKLGLKNIAKTLPGILKQVKKNSTR